MMSDGSERELETENEIDPEPEPEPESESELELELEPERDGEPAVAEAADGAFAAPAARGRALREEGTARPGSGFDPTPYIRQLRGRGGGGDYLDVKWRLLWLRKEHPDAEIVTELVQYDPQMAIFKATVTVPTGGMATGYGSETASDFPDFIEKAETKAIGRALNALGYGAQFGERADDPVLQRGGERASVTPAPGPVPLRQRARAEPRPEPRAEGPAKPAVAATPSPAASDPELIDYSWSAFWPWARERGLNGPKEIEMLIGQPVAGLAPAELRDFILAADSRR